MTLQLSTPSTGQPASRSVAKNACRIVSPVPACEVDRAYRLRKGTARVAFENGTLVGVARTGRGGHKQVWVFEDDARRWFEAGLPLAKLGEVP